MGNVFKSLFGFGGHCQGIRDICIDFEPCLRVDSLISVLHKSIKLGQMIYLSWCRIIDWLKFENRSSSLRNLEMANTKK